MSLFVAVGMVLYFVAVGMVLYIAVVIIVEGELFGLRAVERFAVWGFLCHGRCF